MTAHGKAKEKEKDVTEAPEMVHVEIEDDIGPELEKLLHTPPLQGLSDVQAQERIEKFGRNEMPEQKTNKLLKFLGYFTGTIAFLLEIAMVISFVLGHEHTVDGIILAVVLVANAIIGYHEEAKAENALDALKNTLALKSRVWRNSELVEIDSNLLVPGDVIIVRLGDIIPADCRLLGIGATGEETEGTLQIDQSALTGESLPVAKGKGAIVYSSSICKQGQMLAVVVKTGINTFIGRAANLISTTTDVGHFQKIVGKIGNFLVIITLVMVAIVFANDMIVMKKSILDALSVCVILTVAAIPIGLPTVLSVTMAVGANQLAKKQVIVKRLTAIEELASVSILCSDKTGTLTLNQLTFDEPFLANKGSSPSDMAGTGIKYTSDELLLTSYFSSEPGAHDPIESAVRKAAETNLEILKSRKGTGHDIPGYKVVNFIPFNPTVKYTESRVVDHSTGKQFRCIKGAPQVIIKMCGGHADATKAVIDFAEVGLRALGVARTVDEEMTRFELVGLISLVDPPRHDSAQTIKECEELGVKVKMITGDQQIIGKEVARRLGMGRTILDAKKLIDPTIDVATLTECCEKADGFAQVIPEHKFKVVELLQNKGYLVGMTGDGVNDAPALKKSNVGIAVEGCTDAARSAADIVLLAAGLSTIVDGIKTSRAIFQRMRSYALYRIASTIHFLLFFFIVILGYQFQLPSMLLIMIALLNDAATLVIAFDNAKINQRPDKWRIGQLLFLSFVLGFLLTLISLGHFYVGRYMNLTTWQLHSVIYLNVSSCPHFVIFSTRLTTYFWKNIPSWTFIIAVGGTQVIAMFMAVYGVERFEAAPIGWFWALGVMSVSIVSFMLLDIVKVFIIENWSFELTATLWPSPKRRQELEKRQAHKIKMDRIYANFAKVRKVGTIIYAASVFAEQGKLAAAQRNAGVKKQTAGAPHTSIELGY